MKRSAAEILREYGPFPGVEQVDGVTYDGQHVWFASGDKLNALRSREREESPRDRCRRACRNGFRRSPPVPAFRRPHPEDRSEYRPRAQHDSRARGRRIGACVGRRDALDGAISEPEDPSNRSQTPGRFFAPSNPTALSRESPGSMGSSGTPLWKATKAICGASILQTGEVLERLEMPPGVSVSGLESDGGDRFFCGGGSSGKVRAVRRPKRRAA